VKKYLLELVGFLAVVVMIYGWVRLPRTSYGPGFSVENFSKIRVGTSEKEAFRLVGYPLFYSGGECYYSRPGGSILPIYHWQARSLVFSNCAVVQINNKDAVFN